ncbi:MAG: ankyrin repeat domain-containing protein [Desulfuromonadales bacterium]|nr:ankyrin repeat domain-containing protein [Desulfuromonadales bacterium]
MNKTLFLELLGCNKDNKEKVEALLAKGADVNAREGRGYTPLLLAASHKNCYEVVELLIVKGADVNAKHNKDNFIESGNTPLLNAAREGSKEIVELLITKGADVNAKNDDQGWTPLHRAAQEGNKEVAEFLISRGADVNAKSKYGSTPLHSAAKEGHKKVVELLISRGADLNATEAKVGSTPLRVADKKGKKEVVVLLQAAMQKQEELTTLLQSGNQRETFNQVMADYKGRVMSDSIRRPFITLSAKIKPAPEVPEEARKYLVRGNALLGDAKNTGEARAAITEYQNALLAAPWWGDAYYNLSKAQELAGDLDGTISSMQYYLLTEPQDKREAQDRLYAIEAKRDKVRGK